MLVQAKHTEELAAVKSIHEKEVASLRKELAAAVAKEEGAHAEVAMLKDSGARTVEQSEKDLLAAQGELRELNKRAGELDGSLRVAEAARDEEATKVDEWNHCMHYEPLHYFVT